MFAHEPETQFDLSVKGVIRKGYGVASGNTGYGPYPGGTLALQSPHFREHGVDLSGFFLGTLNVDISPLRHEVQKADVTLRRIAWTPRIPPEDFSFWASLLEARGETYRALVYRPHPETKVEHFQNDSLIEVLAPWVKDVGAGSHVTLRFRSSQVKVCRCGIQP